MTRLYIQGLLLVVAVAGSTTNTQCLKNAFGKMPCKKIEKTLFVISGDNLTLNCSCFNKTNGQWSGPNKQSRLYSTAGDLIPYTINTDLNPTLSKSKYKIYGGYDVKTCNLTITNFLEEDDGKYICQYILNMDPSTVFVHIYYIVATSLSMENQVVKSTEPEKYTFKTKDNSCNTRKYDYFVSKLIGSLIGGCLILSICSNIYLLLKRKRTLNMVPEVHLEGQYDEIGITIDNSANIQDPTINVRESVPIVVRSASLRTTSDKSSFEKGSSTDSSVQSLSNTQLNEDRYEHPYQMIDPEHFEAHMYNTLRSNAYQNTIIFHEIRANNAEHAIQNDNKRDPWLIIHKRNFAIA